MTQSDNKLYINQNIELIIDEGPYQGNYKSKVSDITPEGIKVMAIYKKEEIIPLRKGSKVEVLFEGDNAYYSLKTEVIKRIKNRVPLLVLKNNNKINRIQRRNFFRLKLTKQIEYILLEDNKDKIQKKDYQTTTAINLSGGGLLMVLKENMKINDRVLIDLNIDDIDKMLKGKVVRIRYNKDGYSKTAGIKFIDLDRKDRDKIISYLFNYQRKLRRRGMI